MLNVKKRESKQSYTYELKRREKERSEEFLVKSEMAGLKINCVSIEQVKLVAT